MADSESDVSKALAAFGAPQLRYRSFIQSAVRPPMPGGEDAAASGYAPPPAIRPEPFAPTRFVPEMPDDPVTRAWSESQASASLPAMSQPVSEPLHVVPPLVGDAVVVSSDNGSATRIETDRGDMRLVDLFVLLGASPGGAPLAAP